MKSKYICRECGEDLPGLSISAKTSNVGTVDELVHHFDPCNCKYHQENENIDKIYELEQENAKLKHQLKLAHDTAETYEVRAVKAEAKLHNMEDGLRRLGTEILSGKDLLARSNGEFTLFVSMSLDPNYSRNMTAPTLADLIDKILTGGE